MTVACLMINNPPPTLPPWSSNPYAVSGESDVDRVRQESGIGTAAERWLAESFSTTSQSDDALEGYPKGGGGGGINVDRSEQAHGLLEDGEDVDEELEVYTRRRGGNNMANNIDDNISSSSSLGTASSSEFDFSSVNPLTVGDIWGSSKEQSGADAGGTAGGIAGGTARGNAVDVRVAGGKGRARDAGVRDGEDLSSSSSAAMSTPGREAALRLEALTATVAATVAEVAAETYTGSALEGFNTSTSGSRPTTTSGGGNPLGGLPLAGSKSPPPRAPAPGRRPRETDSSGEGFATAAAAAGASRPVAMMRRVSTADTCSSGDRFVGWLPLAGSRSPPVVRLPGRREPDSSGVESLDAGPPPPPPIAARVDDRAMLPPRNKSPGRGRRRRRRGGGDGVRGGAIPSVPATVPVFAGAAAAAGAGASLSVASSAPLDLSLVVSGERSRMGGATGGMQQRQRQRQHDAAEYAEDEQEALLLSRGRRSQSENSWWEKENSNSSDDDDDPAGGVPPAPVDANRRGARGKGAVVRGGGAPQQEGEVGFGVRRNANNSAARRSAPGMFPVAACPPVHRAGGAKPKHPGERWLGADGRWTSAARAVEAVETGPGLRPTHFAPGYVGVAWPDPTGGDGGAPGSSRARARILTKLEEAASRKLADIEERAHRARRERSDRTKRRCGFCA